MRVPMLLLLFLALPVAALALPEWGDLLPVLAMRDYNTRVVIIGTTMMGIASGVVGTFLMLRKRALMSDVISHATLPGIAGAFLWMASIGGSGKNLPVLLLGAAASGTLGVLAVVGITRWTRIKDSTALAIVLSTGFALGITLLGIASRQEAGNAAGLETYIYGKTASMLMSDAMLIGAASLVAVGVCVALSKEFTILCFDEGYAGTQGWPTFLLDLLLMGLVILVTVVGLQAVGLILVVAMLVVPPAAARFWTHRIGPSMAIAAAIGGASAWIGCALSALLPNLPAGAIIVLCTAAFFGASLAVGRERGLLHAWRRHARLSRRMREQHLLRLLLEIAEARGNAVSPEDATIGGGEVRAGRSWPKGHASRALRRGVADEYIQRTDTGDFRLTHRGTAEARRVVRNHRLWEMYLINHAEIAPSHVDRDADMVEHVLDADMVRQLEQMVADGDARPPLPPSPHELGRGGGGGG